MDNQLVNDKNIRFKATRSSGPGGMNVERRSTRVQIWVKVADLPISDDEKKILRQKLAHKMNHDDEIEVTNQEEPSQELNREKAIALMNEFIAEALKKPAPRFPEE
jgi:ribosome-associated protein